MTATTERLVITGQIIQGPTPVTEVTVSRGYDPTFQIGVHYPDVRTESGGYIPKEVYLALIEWQEVVNNADGSFTVITIPPIPITGGVCQEHYEDRILDVLTREIGDLIKKRMTRHGVHQSRHLIEHVVTMLMPTAEEDQSYIWWHDSRGEHSFRVPSRDIEQLIDVEMI